MQDGICARLMLGSGGAAGVCGNSWMRRTPEARGRGNEGVMLKSLNSKYQPGRRGLAWLKLKRESGDVGCGGDGRGVRARAAGWGAQRLHVCGERWRGAGAT